MQMKGKNVGGLGTRLLEIKGFQYVQLLLHWGRQEQVDKVCDICLHRRTLQQKVDYFICSIHLWREGEERWMWGGG